jgi:hypothetical protein
MNFTHKKKGKKSVNITDEVCKLQRQQITEELIWRLEETKCPEKPVSNFQTFDQTTWHMYWFLVFSTVLVPDYRIFTENTKN